MNTLTNFFKGNDENYEKAKKGLRNVKKHFDGFVISFPDVTPDEIIFIKDKWEHLPKKMARGVKIMALHFKDDLKTLLTEYKPNSYIMPHKHLVEYEIGRVLSGSITNKLTGETFNEGDEYRFKPNEVHYLLSSKEGCLVYSALTLKSEHKLKSLPKKRLNQLKSA